MTRTKTISESLSQDKETHALTENALRSKDSLINQQNTELATLKQTVEVNLVVLF